MNATLEVAEVVQRAINTVERLRNQLIARYALRQKKLQTQQQLLEWHSQQMQQQQQLLEKQQALQQQQQQQQHAREVLQLLQQQQQEQQRLHQTHQATSVEANVRALTGQIQQQQQEEEEQRQHYRLEKKRRKAGRRRGEKRECGGPGCTSLGVRRCKACRRHAYCGEECQRAHWNAGHKQEFQFWREEEGDEPL